MEEALARNALALSDAERSVTLLAQEKEAMAIDRAALTQAVTEAGASLQGTLLHFYFAPHLRAYGDASSPFRRVS